MCRVQCKSAEWGIRMLVTMKILFIMCQVALSAGQHVEEWSREDFLKREHTLVKPYQSIGTSVPLWDFVGSTMITSNFVRLTPDRQSKQGAIWNNVACVSPAWEVQIQFKVHGGGTELYGDGFAFWYARDRMVLGSVFGNQELFSGLGIFLDTYSNQNGPHNHGHPYISAMVNNGSQAYDHDSDGTHTELAGCEAKFRGANLDPTIAVRYEPDVLTVSIDLESRRQWTECMRVTGVHLPTGYYFGASATTGDLADNHDILSLRVYELASSKGHDAAQRRLISPAADTAAPHRDHTPDRGVGVGRYAWKGFKLFLVIFLSIVCLLVIVIGGVYFYKRHSRNQRKRFY